MPTVNFTIDDGAYTILRDTSNSLSVEAEKAVHAATQLTHEKPCRKSHTSFHVRTWPPTKSVSTSRSSNRSTTQSTTAKKGRASHLAAVAVAQGLTRGTV